MTTAKLYKVVEPNGLYNQRLGDIYYAPDNEYDLRADGWTKEEIGFALSAGLLVEKRGTIRIDKKEDSEK